MKRIATLMVLLLSVSLVGMTQSHDDPQVQADELFNEGNSLLRAGNFAEAVNKYSEALNIVKDYRYYHQKAVALLRMERFEESIDAFTSALEHGSDADAVQLGLSHAYMGMGERYFSAGNFSNAITQYRKAVEVTPDPRYYNRLAIAYRRNNQEREAIGAFKSAIELDPQYELAYVGLGGTYVSLEEFDNAIEAYTTALELRPNLRQASVGLATAYTAQGHELLNRGRVRDAIGVLENAIEANPQHSQAYLFLAVGHNRITQSEQAEQYARRAIEYKQRGRTGAEYFELGISLRNQGKRQEAIRAFEEAAKDPQYRRNAEYELEELRR